MKITKNVILVYILILAASFPVTGWGGGAQNTNIINVEIDNKVIGTFKDTHFLTDRSLNSGCSYSRAGSDAFLIAKLRQPVSVDRITLNFCEKSRKENCRIYISSDVISWLEVKAIIVTSGHDKGKLVARVGGKTAQFIKFFVPKPGTEIRISEIEVFEKRVSGILISDIKVGERGDDFIRIFWHTRIPTVSKVLYNPRGETAQTYIDTQNETEHSVVIRGLLPGLVYDYKIAGFDESGKEEVSDLDFFMTGGARGFSFDKVEFSGISSEWAQMKISGNSEFKYILKFGFDPGALDGIQQAADFGLEHQVFLDGLQPDKKYFYRLECIDKYGKVFSTNGGFNTVPKNIALNRPVEGTFDNPYSGQDVFRGTSFISRINDGNEDWYMGMATSGDMTASDQYVIIDLESAQKISKVVVVWRKLAYSMDYSIEVSDNKKSWKEVKKSIDAETGLMTYSKDGSAIVIKEENLSEVEGRFIRLLCLKGSRFFVKNKEWNYVQIMEIKVF